MGHVSGSPSLCVLGRVASRTVYVFDTEPLHACTHAHTTTMHTTTTIQFQGNDSVSNVSTSNLFDYDKHYAELAPKEETSVNPTNTTSTPTCAYRESGG